MKKALKIKQIKRDEGITSEKARFILEQAKEHLKSQIEACDRLKDKSYILFGALASFATALIVFY